MSNFRRNFYSSIQQSEQEALRWFDEGPLIKKNYIGINSSSINTSQIDQFRQGVEISQEKYVVGMMKISAGTAGHIVKPNSYGVDLCELISPDIFFEIEYFDPVKWISVQKIGVNIERVFTFPIITSDNNEALNKNFNGIIEPLSIRPVASFFSIEFPFESHAMRGSMMAGNSEQRLFSCDQVLTVDFYPDLNKLQRRVNFFDPNNNLPASASFYPGLINRQFFLDAFESISDDKGVPVQSVGYVNHNFNNNAPFHDEKVLIDSIGITEKNSGTDMYDAMSALLGFDESGYIPPGKKSGTAGLVYDNIGKSGTDSIAFGGMTY